MIGFDPQRPLICGLPKTNKESIPLRLIFSMIGSSQHEFAKMVGRNFGTGTKAILLTLNKRLLHICQLYPNHNLESAKIFLGSFDINSLFTKVPLDENIEICYADAVYRSHLDYQPFPEDTFRELMLIATRGVECCFNNQMYKKLDSVAMGIPLGQAVPNVFVALHESRLSENATKHGVYFRYVTATLVISVSKSDCDHFEEKMNLLHPALKFTVEKEQKNFLNFVDVSAEKEGSGLFTSIYKKPTLTGQYIC